jgi:hypothetical protein
VLAAPLLEPPPLEAPVLAAPPLEPPLLEAPVLAAPPLEPPPDAPLDAPLEAPPVDVTWVLDAPALPEPPDEPPPLVAPHALTSRAAATRPGTSHRRRLRPACDPPGSAPSSPTSARSFRSSIVGTPFLFSRTGAEARLRPARTIRPGGRSGHPLARLHYPGCDRGVTEA